MRWITAGLIVLLAGAGGVQAQGRPQTPAMTCNQVRSLVASAGGIVLGTGGYTYDRYVNDARFCLMGQWIRRQSVPTVDTPYCPLNVCYDPSGSRWDRD